MTIYARLLTYFQSQYRSIYAPIVIAGCCVVSIDSNAQAQIGAMATIERDVVEPAAIQAVGAVPQPDRCQLPQLRSRTATAVLPLPTCAQNLAPDLHLQHHRVKSDRVAQVLPASAIPFILPQKILPAFSSLIPPSEPLVPLNAILTPTLVAPNNRPAVPLDNAPTQDRRFIVPPRELPPQQVDPFSTQYILNGDRISHLTPTVVKSGFESGNFRNSDLNFNVYQILRADNIQSVTTDSVVRVKSQIESVGIRSIAQTRQVTTNTTKPQTLLGARQQIGLSANCRDNSGQTCTYIPGITIDESTIDPRKLQPTGVKITSQYGDVISPASVAAIAQPGFQGGANGQQFGIDLYLPALGLVDTPRSQTAPATGTRREDLNTTVAINATRMERDFATNGVESTLSQTIRSVNYIDGDRHQLVNLAVQAVSQILPSAQIGIAPGRSGAKIVVNPNLYRAANAIRIPDSSQTIYQAGSGAAPSRSKDPNTLPGANHQAIWIGLSPVVERTVVKDYEYLTRAPVRIVSSNGGEAGVPVAVQLNNFGFNSDSLQNPYSQGYLTVYNRDVDRADVEILRQRTDYYPHISFTGVNMSENSLWRYYTGAIATIGSSSSVKAYIGADYSTANKQGLTLGVGGIGYLNPDPEYASQLFVSTSQSIRLGANTRHNLRVGMNANYIIDGTVTVQSIPVRSSQSYINAGITFELGDVSIGGTQFFGNLLPDSTESKTLFNIGWKISSGLNVGVFYTAADRNISTNPYGASLSWALDPGGNSVLSLSWNAAEIDFRRTLGANANIYRDNTFGVSARLGL